MTDCNNNNNHTCWDFTGEKYGPSANFPADTDPSFIDNSGMSWSREGITTMQVMVDTNGLKPPNKMGKDRWLIMIVTSDDQYTGNLTKVRTNFSGGGDDLTSNSWACPSPPCYYQSWLIGSN